jgi:zinc protease
VRALRAIALAVVPWALLACTAPAWEQPPPPTREAPVVQPESLVRTELGNGLHVIVLRDRRLPRVSLGVTVRRGEGMIGVDRAGVAPFTAELMKRGAGDRGALDLARAVDGVGARLSVTAGWDAVNVRVSGLSRDFDRLLEILADVALRPRFEEAEARKARDEELAALERAREDPAVLARWNVSRALYGGHRFGLPKSGTPETLARLDAAAARDFHGFLFRPNNAVLSASGDIEPEEFLRRARETFGSGSWEAGPLPDPGPPPPERAPPARRLVVVDRPDLVQARITLAHEGIARSEPQRVAVALMNSVLGGSGFSSRLTTRVRAEEGLTYSLWSGFSLRRQPGPFLVSTFTRVSQARRVVDLLLEELDRARSEPPTEAELRRARALAVGRFALGLETSAAVAESLVDLDIHGLPEDSLDTYRGRVRAVTVEDTAREARRLLHPERAAIVLVGPAEQLVPAFEDLGPLEMVQP